MPVYDAMIRRDDEDGPDPLVPEPLSTEPDRRPLGIPPKRAKKAGKSAKSAKKGTKHGKT